MNAPDYCVECLKETPRYEKVNGLCPSCHKRIIVPRQGK